MPTYETPLKKHAGDLVTKVGAPVISLGGDDAMRGEFATAFRRDNLTTAVLSDTAGTNVDNLAWALHEFHTGSEQFSADTRDDHATRPQMEALTDASSRVEAMLSNPEPTPEIGGVGIDTAYLGLDPAAVPATIHTTTDIDRATAQGAADVLSSTFAERMQRQTARDQAYRDRIERILDILNTKVVTQREASRGETLPQLRASAFHAPGVEATFTSADVAAVSAQVPIPPSVSGWTGGYADSATGAAVADQGRGTPEAVAAPQAGVTGGAPATAAGQASGGGSRSGAGTAAPSSGARRSSGEGGSAASSGSAAASSPTVTAGEIVDALSDSATPAGQGAGQDQAGAAHPAAQAGQAGPAAMIAGMVPAGIPSAGVQAPAPSSTQPGSAGSPSAAASQVRPPTLSDGEFGRLLDSIAPGAGSVAPSVGQAVRDAASTIPSVPSSPSSPSSPLAPKMPPVPSLASPLAHTTAASGPAGGQKLAAASAPAAAGAVPGRGMGMMPPMMPPMMGSPGGAGAGRDGGKRKIVAQDRDMLGHDIDTVDPIVNARKKIEETNR